MVRYESVDGEGDGTLTSVCVCVCVCERDMMQDSESMINKDRLFIRLMVKCGTSRFELGYVGDVCAATGCFYSR